MAIRSLLLATALGLSLSLSACGEAVSSPEDEAPSASALTSAESNPPAASPSAGNAAVDPSDLPDDYASAEAFDPIERLNRATFAFNRAADRYVLHPLVVGYRYIVPEFARNGISNVLDNWYEPVNTVNALFQGKFEVAANSAWRFIINSSLGLLGFADVASEAGLRAQKEDLGQTLGHYGVDSGPYLVLPLLGPSSVRDGGGLIGDVFVDPSTYFMTERDLWWRAGAKGFDARYRSDKLLEETIYNSVDPYATMRSLYLQRRAALVAE